MNQDCVHELATLNRTVGRQFVLYRYKDLSGVSGEGTVAEGIEFANGQVALRWYPKTYNSKKREAREAGFTFRGSISVFQSIDEIIAIHGHHGNTKVLYLDEMAGVPSNKRIYDPPWENRKIMKFITKLLKKLILDYSDSTFNKTMGSIVGMIRVAEKNAYRRGWNDSVLKNKL